MPATEEAATVGGGVQDPPGLAQEGIREPSRRRYPTPGRGSAPRVAEPTTRPQCSESPPGRGWAATDDSDEPPMAGGRGGPGANFADDAELAALAKAIAAEF